MFEQFKERVLECAAESKFADGFEEGATHGPINNKMQFDRVSELVEDAKAAGATVLCGGRQIEGTPAEAYFYAPTILSDVAEGVRVVDEEQFGPVLLVKHSNSFCLSCRHFR